MSPEMIISLLVILATFAGAWHFYGVVHRLEQRTKRAEDIAKNATFLLAAHVCGVDIIELVNQAQPIPLRETDKE